MRYPDPVTEIGYTGSAPSPTAITQPAFSLLTNVYPFADGPFDGGCEAYCQDRIRRADRACGAADPGGADAVPALTSNRRWDASGGHGTGRDHAPCGTAAVSLAPHGPGSRPRSAAPTGSLARASCRIRRDGRQRPPRSVPCSSRLTAPPSSAVARPSCRRDQFAGMAAILPCVDRRPSSGT